MTRRIILHLVVGCLGCLWSAVASAAGDITTVKGTFYVSVDDAAKIFVDGQEVMQAKYGESRSAEIELKVGQRLVARIANDVGQRRFMLVFLSTDRKTAVSFKNTDFRIVHDVAVTDFTLEEFAKWSETAEQEKHDAVFDFKNQSEWVWGNLNKSTLATVITADMIRKIAK